jgi:hypothetical protein
MSFHDGNRGRRGRNPLDIRALNRDEDLFNALGQGARPNGVDGDPVVDLLYRWRADLEANVNTIEISAPATGVGMPAVRPSRRASGLLTKAGRRIIVAAAALVIGLGSVGGLAAATGAGPDSTFWPVALALNTERARSVQAAKDVKALLDSAETEIRNGQLDPAADKLSQANQLLPRVQNEDQGPQLRIRLGDLNNRLIQARAEKPGTGQTGRPGGTGNSSGTGRQAPGGKVDPSRSQTPRPTPSGSKPPPSSSPTPTGSGTAGPTTPNPVSR